MSVLSMMTGPINRLFGHVLTSSINNKSPFYHFEPVCSKHKNDKQIFTHGTYDAIQLHFRNSSL